MMAFGISPAIQAEQHIRSPAYFYVTCRDYLHQVLVPVVVLGQQYQVVIFPVVLVLYGMIVFRDVYLASYDGLDFRVFSGVFEKFLHPVHVPVVSDGQSRHSELFRSLEQFFYG